MTRSKRILIVDDEPGIRTSITAILETEYLTATAATGGEALQMLQGERYDLVLLDIRLPDLNGMQVLREIREMDPNVPVIMVSAVTEARGVVDAIKCGADDYVTKPFDINELRHVVQRVLANSSLKLKVQVLQKEVDRRYPLAGVIGASPVFTRVLEDVRKVAQTDTTVLICGESGSGKELIARLLHDLSPHKDEPFIAIDCAVLSELHLETELFGHEKGAFVNAESRKIGLFEMAEHGTLFFDEVSEMSPSTQVKLLRVLEQREFIRVGGTQSIPTKARIVAASARDLRAAVAAGTFRDDLYYRLSVVPIQLPPLRQRVDDVELLARHFVETLAGQLNAETEEIEAEAMTLLQAYAWPGNVRELRNVVERMLVLHGRSKTISAAHLPEEFHDFESPSETGGNTLEDQVHDYERQLIELALKQAGGVQTRAAKILGTTRRILKYKMDKLGIDAGADDQEAE